MIDKWKLSQNRPAEDQARVINELNTNDHLASLELAARMLANHKRCI